MSGGRAVVGGIGALVLAALLGLGACTLFGGDAPPDRTCESDSDCFRAQGERCETDAGVCMLIDAGGAP